MAQKRFLLLSAIFFTGICLAQQDQTTPKRNCGSYDYYQNMLKNDPDFAAKQIQLEQATENYIESKEAMKLNGNEQIQQILTVSVVFHIIYNTTTQNISDQRITEQIAILNKDFSATNTDISNVPSAFSSLVGNAGIQFCLAKVDPSGNATTGIIRTQTSTTSFSTDDAVKFSTSGGDNIWDRTKYLNIWICNLGGGLLGYSTFPGSGAAYDGVVLTYQYVGTTGVSAPYNKGRTATHEVGHWFNMYHIWGDSNCGDDKVSDTPTQQSANYGCPSFPSVTCSNGSNGDMFMNYMDYSDDGCMAMFSKGQASRMQATFANTSSPRYSLFNSTACGALIPTLDAGISAISYPTGTICSTSITPIVTLNNFGTTILTSVTIQYTVDGGNAVIYNWSGSLTGGASTDVTLAMYASTSGSHTISISSSNPNSSTDVNTANDAASLNYLVRGAGLALPFSEGFESTTFPPTNWTVNNVDNKTTWTRSTSAKKTGTASSVVKNYSYTNAQGQKDELITPSLDLTTSATPVMDFWVAYTYYTSPYKYSDTLEVLVSTDCGNTLTSLYKSWGNNLATASATTSSFVPTASQWKQISIPLSSYASYNNATFYFRNITDYENNMYIDDINLNETTTGITELNSNGINIYPNPSKGDIFIDLGSENKRNNTVINAYNMLGEKVITQQVNGNSSDVVKIEMNELPQGMYIIEVISSENKFTQKILFGE